MSRVGEVAVRLRLAASEQARADETRRHIERVVIQQALDELERLVHERFGTAAIVRVRRLSARWRIARDDLADHAISVGMAEDLAQSVFAEIEALPGPARLRPTPPTNVAVFTDQDHADAAFFADAYEQRTCWFHPSSDVADVWTAVRAGGEARIEAVTRWLERMDLAAPIVRWLVTDGVIRTDDHRPARAPTMMPHEQSVAGAPPTAGDSRVSSAPAAQPAHVAPTSELPPSPEPLVVDGTAPLVIRSEAAGAWYFARLVLELDLAEHLWCAGVAEGAFLSHVVAALLGGGLADPAWRWFGGFYDREPIIDALPEWAAIEVRDKLASSLARVLGDASASVDRMARQLPPVAPCPDVLTAEIVAKCAASLLAAFCARLGSEPDLTVVRKHVLLPGRFVLGKTLRVELAMELLDVDVRRAGLDFNPGYVPWLERKVEIVFE